MVDILVRGGDAEAAAKAIAGALREIFAVEPTRSTARAEDARAFDLVMLLLSIPPAIVATADLAGRLKLVERFDRLIARAAEQKRLTGAALLIDPGDGRPIPLEQASRDQIMAALTALQARLRR